MSPSKIVYNQDNLSLPQPGMSVSKDLNKTKSATSKPQDIFYFPPDISNDLEGVDLSPEFKAECFACAWEYIRCIIPQYTNWNRYVAFMRIIIIATIAEARGDLVDLVAEDDNILGYNLQELIDTLFRGTSAHSSMGRECRTNILISSEKASSRRHNSELFRRYVNALASSPRNWFRMRDNDAITRLSIAAALACNDLDDLWFTDEQFEMLNELGILLYDAVAFYKHRSEGETNSTFAYMPDGLRTKAFHTAREILWALDVAWVQQQYHQSVINFIRFFGGPIHMMMRRYRFVEEGLTIGKSDEESLVDENRRKVKLWNRVDAKTMAMAKVDHASNVARYKAVLARSDKLLFPDMADFLETDGDGICSKCLYRESYGAQSIYQFGGVQLCDNCKIGWKFYLDSLSMRAAEVFPELQSIMGYLQG